MTSLQAFEAAAQRARAGQDPRVIARLVVRDLTGREPGDVHARPTALDATLPPALDGWWVRAVGRRHDDRFRSAKEMLEALAVALGIPPAERGAALRDVAPTPIQMPTAFAPPTPDAAPASGHSWTFAVLAIPLVIVALLLLVRR